jgi:hypothetical protein
LGLVASLNRPGGNLTGSAFLADELAPKPLQLLRDLIPRDTVIETVAPQETRGWRVSMQRSLTVDRLLRATVNSWWGLCGAAQSEAAAREERVAIVLAVPLAFVVAESSLKRFALIFFCRAVSLHADRRARLGLVQSVCRCLAFSAYWGRP